MIMTRSVPRAGMLLAATALLGGLAVTAVPAQASGGDHTVAVDVVGGNAGTWTTYLSCTPSGGGAAVVRSAQATVSSVLVLFISVPSWHAQFQHLPDGTCDIQSVSTSLLGSSSYGTASSRALTVTSNVSRVISADAAATLTCATAPSLTGRPVVGQPLTVAAPTFVGGIAETRYSWYRSGVAAPVQASTSPRYTPTQADVGHQVSAVASGRMIGLSAISGLAGIVGQATCPSATTATVTGGSTPVPTTPPGVVGKPEVGHRIAASPAAAPAGTKVTGYQWYVQRVVSGHGRSERVVTARLKGAHHRWLRLKERLAGKHVLVAVTYSLAGSTPAKAFSHAIEVERQKEGF